MHGSPQALDALARTRAARGDAEATGELLDWLRVELSTWNAELLAGRRTAAAFGAELQAKLEHLPSPLDCSLPECRRLLVMLGMVGSSLERHSQEAGAAPGAALRPLRAGATSFRRYVATLASRAGGPPRDSFLSYVLWNMPPVAVYVPGEPQAALMLPGAFGSDPPITFSGTVAEEMFLTLLKRCAALEEIANEDLLPICDGELAPDDPSALARVDRSSLLLRSVRAEMRIFMGRPEFTAEFMLDELRQYACPWDDLDAYNAPSGGHDTAFIVRDNLLGIAIPGYDTHVLEQFDVLDDAGQRDVLRSLTTVSIAARLAAAVGRDGFRELESADAEALLATNPWLVHYVRLYQANAALDATHWAMIMKYMIKPMRQRDYDAIVVSNHAGTTHMWMDTLKAYMDARNDHPLLGLKDAVRAGEGLGLGTAGQDVIAVGPADPEASSAGGSDAEVRAVYEMAALHNSDDIDGTRRFYTADVAWHVQGNNPSSGTRAGIDALIEYFKATQAATGGTLRLHPQTVAVTGDLVGVLMRVTARRDDGRYMDTLLAQALRLAPDGRWCEYRAVADDQEAVDAFWA
ncbi:MAG: nuclear transport factor 2 family protein [Jatrophihabitans sp.]|uniref:nuclear transport factor 2 family protein n=1 Tax=Jatrophihabitans sp. TaxID=1932789 RepID=UPI003913CB75